MSRRSQLLLSNSFSVLLALLGYLLVLAISNDFQRSFDLTSDNRHSFSVQTEELMQKLSEPVMLYAFVDPLGDTSSIESLLERYKKLNSRFFNYRLVDLQKNPTLAESLEVRSYGQAVLQLETPNSEQSEDLAPRRERLFTFDEANITNALGKLLRSEDKSVYFVVGHGERRPDQSDSREMSQLSQSLRMEGYNAKVLNLTEASSIPADADLMVIAGPRGDLLPTEQKLLDSYLQDGGKLLFMADIATSDSYCNWLRGYGIEIRDSVIIDETSALVGAEPVTPIGAAYSPEHPITKRFRNITAFTLARPVEVGEVTSWTSGGTPRLEVLVRTRASAYLLPLSRIVGQESVEFSSEGQEPAAFPLAVAGLYPLAATQDDHDSSQEQQDKEEEESDEEETSPPPPPPPSTRIVAFGSVETFTNGSLGMADNRDLILNTIAWLGESESQITMRVVDPKVQTLRLEKQKQNWLFFLFLVLIPFLTALTGILIAWQRRQGLKP